MTPNRMRILFINSQLPLAPAVEGISSYVLCLGRALVAKGHDVHVLSCLPGQAERDYREDGLVFHIRPRHLIPFIARRLGMRLSAHRLEGAFSSSRAYRQLGADFDVVECPDVAAEGLLFAVHRKNALVVRLHGGILIGGRFLRFTPDYDYRLACELERWMIKHADLVTAPSGLIVRELRRLGWLPDLDCEIVPNPVDWPTWQNVGPADDTDQVILYVGRLDRLKAPELAVEATVELRKTFPEARIVLVGNETDWGRGEPYRKFLSRVAGPNGGCEFIDPVPRSELPSIVEKARVVVVPSQSDTFPMVAVEAMASGRPVVTTDTTGVADFIRRTGAGQVVHGRDPKTLAEALRPFLSDSEFAMAVGGRAREAVRHHLDPGRIAERMEGIYRKAMQLHSQRRIMS